MKKPVLEKNKRALEISIKEGSANGFSAGIANSYITPFALKLSAKEIHIGILSSLVGLISPIAQLWGSKIMERYSRKRIVLLAVLWQAIMWLPLTVIATLKFFNVAESSLIYLLIIGYSLIAALGGIAHPAWFSWMGDLVSEKERGKYFGKRNTIVGIVELIAVIIATGIIKFSEDNYNALIGFAVIFFLAFLFRLISFSIIKNQYSPHAKSRKTYSTSISTLIKENKNYRKFAIYQAFFNFAIMVASPFFAVYMLKDLGFSYTQYIIVSMSGAIFYLLFTPLVGKFSDKYGNVKLLVIANVLFAINPILWIFIKSPIGLVLLPQLVAGIANAAAILSFTNFSYDYLSKKERGVGIAYANILAGVGIFLGSILGGVLLNYLSIDFMSKFFFVFLLASILRGAVALIFLPKVNEKKKVKRLPPMYISVIHPFKTIHAELDWARHVFK